MNIKTSEFVSPKHPDKICDIIADTLLDLYLSKDPKSRVAIEVMGGHGRIRVTGEVTSKANVDTPMIAAIVRRIAGRMKVDVAISAQSQYIADGVDAGGAGDQGIMNGYATRETESLMPYEYDLARRLCKHIYQSYQTDGKTQVTTDGKKVQTVVASFQNTKNDSLLALVKEVIPDAKEYLINPAGEWFTGGFDADSGLSGRKLVVDNYGPEIPIGGGSYCVDADTEYLTPTGWKRISEYKSGLVGQYTKEGFLEFVKPSEYIKVPAENLKHLYMHNGIDQVLSGGHNFVYITTKGHLGKKPFAELVKEHLAAKRGSHARIITTFKYKGGTGLELSNDEIRLQVAAIADGNYPNSKTAKCRFRLLRQEKIDRLRELINNLGLKSTDTVYSDGYTYITVAVPRRDKEFTEYYWNANSAQMKIIAEEVVHWDGDPEKYLYRTTDIKSSDFIQYIWTIIYNKRISIGIDDRIGHSRHHSNGKNYLVKSVCYRLRRTEHSLIGLRSPYALATVSDFTSIDGFQYCFTVPSSMLVLRRGKKIFITGNSGKDWTKVDRSGAYMARKIAVELLKSNEAYKTAQVKLAYAIGAKYPVMAVAKVNMNGYLPIENYDLSPKGIYNALNLGKVSFAETAKWGHYGNDFPWDK